MKVSKDLKKGVKVESEHTKGRKFAEKKASKTKKDMATKIAKDHELEFKGKGYYKELSKMEEKLKNKKKVKK
jgi:hypothetical protein